ncbi:MAG: benzoate/H(+) symporter BenE family transporter [Phormidesmis sp.]
MFGATVGVVFSALPEELVLATAGLALLGAIGTRLAVALTVESSNKQVEGKQVTFLVTASGVTLLGIGSAFWGLLAGVLVTGLRRIGLS